MFIYTTFILTLCATLGLTSSVNKSEPDGFAKNNHVSLADERLLDNGAPSKTISSNTTGEHVEKENRAPMMAEGGPIYQFQGRNSSGDISETASKHVASKDAVERTSDDDSKSKLPKTRNASVVARKGAVPSPKIAARKGVGPELFPATQLTTESDDEASAQVSSDKINIQEHKTISAAVKSINDSEKATTEKTSNSRYSKVDKASNVRNNITGDVSSNAMEKSTAFSTVTIPVPTIATKSSKNSATTLSPSTKKFKPKPTVTIGEIDADEPIPASPTKSPPLGMPRKIDYIVPVIITIMALPLLGGATFFIYRRGRDCWDKRHYRRMDFLIDGMYNDYSWK